MNIRTLAAMAALTLFLIGTSGTVWLHDRDLKQRLEEAEIRIETMRQDHEQTLEAVNRAILAREEVHAENARKITETEKALGKNPDFDCIVVPDDVRMLWEKSAGGNKAGDACDPAGAH